MLEIRPNCEWCNKDLPADAVDAMICTYECTFCKDCVETHLHNVCPNCGGGFCPRPIRPATARRPGISRQHQPASDKRVSLKYDRESALRFCHGVRHIPPRDR
ncbi:DUF1272 domain-containing protein [Eilatimonas milleporae]|uniref:Urease-associated protein n=1 Tax=Eilatimonas milleporae TaxID=911205 RepID=A0A3M0C7Z0_9PROT|nr:DUF1272 domain-containing protein [Eilatimonas milleporae]RMB05005.1 hypothetical protein BXY39_2583 [Eilatimonas milleporae]